MTSEVIDGLAAALSRFQGEGFAIPRTRKVEVALKSGGKYTFEYAPHELIVAAIRKPLADHGLAVSQVLSATSDGQPALRTILLHASGERIEDVFPLPIHETMSAQEMGSAITYVRRYALSSILGLATEDDDDGNKASGNNVTDRTDKPPTASPAAADAPYREDEELMGDYSGSGMVRNGTAAGYKLEARQGPDGHVIGFRMEFRDEKTIPQVIVEGPAGEALFLATSMNPGSLVDTRLTVKGRLFNVKSNRSRTSWKRLRVSEWSNNDYSFPAKDDTGPEPPPDVRLVGEDEAPTAPLFDDVAGAA